MVCSLSCCTSNFRACKWLVQLAMLFIILFCFAWESYDINTGLELNPVFGPCIAAVPVLQEPSCGDNYHLHLSSLCLQEPLCGEMRNGTSPFSSGVDIFCHVTMAIQFLEHPRMLIMVCSETQQSNTTHRTSWRE